MEPYTAPSTRIELKKLSQKFRDCIQMLNVKMEELSKSASRDCGDDIISSSTAGNSPGLQDALIQLQRLCEISEELAVHYEAQTVTQTHKSCTIAASHHPWTDSPTKEEHESAPQSFRVEWQPAVPNHEQFSPHSSITVTGQHAPPVPVNQFPFCGIPFALPDTLEASREFGSDGALAIRPITETPVPRPPNSGLEPLHQYAHCRLLIAEDNAVNQRLISKIFQKLGLPNSTLVINGLLAVEKVQESMEIMLPFDLIFMDESMPVMSGREATRQIRAIGYRGIVCGMTASAFTSDVQGALDAGMDTVLKKPIRTHDIRNVLVQSLPHLPQEPESVSPSPLPRQKPVVKSRL